MGRKQNAADKKPEPKEEAKQVEKKEEEEKKEDNVPEEPAIVKALKEVDDKYLALDREFDREVDKLRKAYEAKQAPFLEERKKMLLESDKENKESGTPALPGFWVQALKNHPAFEDEIQKWDEPVLEYLVDITKAYLDEEDTQKGFKITLVFLENPYFTNTEISKEFLTKQGSPYTGEIECLEVKASVIDWKPGKDVTIERTAKKVKGGGAKKAKQKGKETIEPRDSFFRSVIMSFKQGDPLPEEAELQMQGGMDSDDDDDDMARFLLEHQLEVGEALRDQIIPFAVRWFTGEADPRDDEDDDDEDEEEEEDDDDDDDDLESDDDDEPAPKAKGGPKKPSAKKSPKTSPSAKPAADPKQEECKQQ